MTRLSYHRRSPARLTVCTLLLLSILALMVVIFRLSGESKTDSGNRSGHITEVAASLLVSGFDEMPQAEQDKVVERMHHPIRKLAHMSEYALLAILSGSLLLVWDDRGRFPLILRPLLPFAFCALYAASDEIHQIFSHRGASVIDVLIDCCGAVIGLCLLFGLYSLVVHLRRRKGAAREDHALSTEL